MVPPLKFTDKDTEKKIDFGHSIIIDGKKYDVKSPPSEMIMTYTPVYLHRSRAVVRIYDIVSFVVVFGLVFLASYRLMKTFREKKHQ